MDYLTGKARENFEKWFWNNDKYNQLHVTGQLGTYSIFDLPYSLTVGIVAEWLLEVKFIHPSLVFDEKRLARVSEKYNKDYVEVININPSLFD